MVEANDDISTTEPTLPRAMTWIRRAASKPGLGAMEMLEVTSGMRSEVGSEACCRSGFGFGYMVNLEVSGSIGGFLLFSSLLLLDLGPV
jgi:hypothetical protein